MSDHAESLIESLSETINRQSATMRWLIAGVAGMLMGAVAVGMWLARQENHLHNLAEADKVSLADRAEIKGMVKAHTDTINVLGKDSAVQGRDLQYIRERVTEIAQKMERREGEAR